MQRTFLITILCAILFAAPLAGDIVHLTDGSRREGRIISETDDEVVLEMTIGGIKAQVRIRRDKVARIERKKTRVELLKEEFDRRKKSLKPGDLDAVEALAKWCAARELYAESAGLYQDMSRKGQAGLKRGQLGLSKMELERGRLETAVNVAEELKAALPADEDVLAWAVKLQETRRKNIADSVRHALKQNADGKPGRALKTLQLLLERVGGDDVRKALTAETLPENPELFDYMATLRLSRNCPACKDGELVCKRCKGSGRTATGRFCSTCRGFGVVPCGRCDATGILWDRVPREERPALIRRLGGMADREEKVLVELKEKMTGTNVSVTDIDNSAAEVLRLGRRLDAFRSRALPLIAEPDLIKEFTNKRLAARRLTAGLLLEAAGKTVTLADAKLKEINRSNDSCLKRDEEFRTTRDLMERAVFCYASVDARAIRASKTTKKSVREAKEKLKGVEHVLARNARMKLLYQRAVQAARAEKYETALKALEELVTHAPRRDMDYLAGQFKKDSPASLPEFMAGCRFEAGKDKKGRFGEPTDYEKSAFVALLLNEAGAKAREAKQRYEALRRAKAQGQESYVGAARVKATRKLAEYARDWYQALLTVKYPLRQRTIRQIEETIEEMKHIIRKCKRWYGPTEPTPIFP